MSGPTRMFCYHSRDGASRAYNLAKARRMLEHENPEIESRDLNHLNGLSIGEAFTDTEGDRWTRIK